MRDWGLLAAALCLAWPAAAAAQDAQTPAAACPPFPLLPFDLDTAALEGRDCDPGPLDRLKNIPLGRAQLSFGGEARHRYERNVNPDFGETPEDRDGLFLHRYALYAELRLPAGVRVFGELASALAEAAAERPGPVVVNKLEPQNLFLEVARPLARGITAQARFGRQEVQLGSARLISVRDGPNVRRTFDGVTAELAGDGWRVRGLAVRPRQDRTGVFDDPTDQDVALWGVQAALPQVELLYLGFEDEAALFDQGAGAETRHSFGARTFGARGPLDWNWEGVVQTGRYDADSIFAWTLAADTGVTFRTAPWRPRLALNTNVASGDRDPLDPDLQTFNPFFPRGNYFSEASILGPRNFFNSHLFLTARPTDRLLVGVDANAFWRLRRSDGVYAPNGRVIRSGVQGEARFVGWAVSTKVDYEVSRNLTLEAIYTHFEPGAFLDQSGPNEAVDFFEATARFRF